MDYKIILINFFSLLGKKLHTWRRNEYHNHLDLLTENHLIILLLIMWSQNTFPLGPFCFIKGSRWLIEKCLLHMWKYSWLSPRLFSPLHTKQIIVPYSYLYSLPQKNPDMISYIIQILHNGVFFLKLHCSAYLFLILLYNCFLPTR